MPWRRLSRGWINHCLSSLQITITVAIAALTIARCKNRWQFVVIAVWKLVLSLEVGIWGFRASLWARRNAGKDPPKHIPYGSDIQWFLLGVYSLVTISGLVGLISLIVPIWGEPNVFKITIAFGAAAGIGLLLSFFFWVFYQGHRKMTDDEPRGMSLTTIFTFGLFVSVMSVAMVLFALYCDWMLAVIADNYVGVRTGDNAVLYWVGYYDSSV